MKTKSYTELRDKIKDLIRSITNASGDYDEVCMKIKFNSDDNLPLNKILKLCNLTIVVRSVFQEDDKYYPQFFFESACINYKILECDRIDVSEGIDVSKTNASKESDICHY